MLRLSIFASLLAVASLAAAPTSRAADTKPYTIKMHRIPNFGEKTRDNFKILAYITTRTIAGGKVINDAKQDLRTELSGISEILELSPNARPKSFKFTVEKSKAQTSDGPPWEPFKPGTVLRGAVDESGKVTYTSSTGDISGLGEKLLQDIFQLRADRPDDTNDDVALNTTQPRTIGSEWDFDKAALLKTMPDDAPFKVSGNEISGKVKFPFMRKLDGREHCVLQVDLLIKPTHLTTLPPGVKLTTANFGGRLERWVPVDPKAVPPFQKTSMQGTAAAVGDTPNGKVSVEFTFRQEVEIVSHRVE